jgi:catechol 2,3-dioxygenase-like lactoylglutathione lyase family enzyme
VFDHVTIRCSDLPASESFYDTVLAAIGIARDEPVAEFVQWDDFSIAAATGEHPVTRGVHIGFVAPSREAVDRFWEAGTAAGYRSDGEPGPRPQYRDDYYGSFLLDPDGNSAEAVWHGALRRGGVVDHIWIRVADVAAARDFYLAVAPHAGFKLRLAIPERAHFGAGNGAFAVVGGDHVTVNLHMAFPVSSDDAVREFHAALTGAGYRDNGAPGERSQYHAGYYGAFVLDPDGNNVELVHHNR